MIKKIKSLVVVLVGLMLSLTLFACVDEQTLLYQYEGIGQTQDAPAFSFVTVMVIVSDVEADIEFAASDFSVVRNGVKENGTVFITGFTVENFNGNKIYKSITAPTFTVKNDEGADLKIVFTGADNITELYHKGKNIPLTK